MPDEPKQEILTEEDLRDICVYAIEQGAMCGAYRELSPQARARILLAKDWLSSVNVIDEPEAPAKPEKKAKPAKKKPNVRQVPRTKKPAQKGKKK